MIKAAKFIFQYQSENHFPVEILPLTDEDKGHDSTIIFRPLNKKNQYSRPRDVILIVHGMTMYGNRDPRYISLCKSLAGCGYTVVLPLFKSIRDLKIVPSSIDDIKSAILSITGNNEICPEGRLSLFTNSFSGSMCLMAAADEALSGKVKSMCLIGSYSNIESSIEFLLGNQNSDPYGRLIILKNFLNYSMNVSEQLDQALQIAIEDNFYEKDGRLPQIHDYLKTMDHDDLQEFNLLCNNQDYRMYHWVKIRKHPEIENNISKFTLQNYLNKISSSVLLIHGIDDRVIHPHESVRLYKELISRGVKTKLLLTPLIMDHSALKINLQLIIQVLDLFNGLNFYFKTA